MRDEASQQLRDKANERIITYKSLVVITLVVITTPVWILSGAAYLIYAAIRGGWDGTEGFIEWLFKDPE